MKSAVKSQFLVLNFVFWVASFSVFYLLFISFAHAQSVNGCICDSSNNCFAQSLSRQKLNIEFVWEFDKPYRCGFFANGDPWIASIDQNGNPTDGVLIVNISPEGEEHGAQMDPFGENAQGFFNTYGNYDPQLNVMTQLPFRISGVSTVVKVRTQSTDCGTRFIERQCASIYDVLTIVSDVPEHQWVNHFRPGLHGPKSLDSLRYTVQDLMLERLPRLDVDLQSGGADPDFNDIATFIAYTTQVETMHHYGEQMRAQSPHAVVNDYYATKAVTYYNQLFQVFGNHSDTEKLPAVIALVQQGLDAWSLLEKGGRFASGAGQHIGPGIQIITAASLLADEAFQAAVRERATAPEYHRDVQIFGQIYWGRDESGAQAEPLWGDGPCRDGVDIDTGFMNFYWSRLISRLRGGYDGKGTQCDPHGYIDGPPGSPETGHPSGRDYSYCCSGSLHITEGFLGLLMPYRRVLMGDDKHRRYADRHMGRGVPGDPGFPGGFWSQPDPCAAPDPIDINNPECQPYSVTGRAACEKYGLSGKSNPTWGPDPANPRECIRTSDPARRGRYPDLHGITKNFLRVPFPLSAHWETLRDCADPIDPSYPCAGLGPKPYVCGDDRCDMQLGETPENCSADCGPVQPTPTPSVANTTSPTATPETAPADKPDVSSTPTPEAVPSSTPTIEGNPSGESDIFENRLLKLESLINRWKGEARQIRALKKHISALRKELKKSKQFSKEILLRSRKLSRKMIKSIRAQSLRTMSHRRIRKRLKRQFKKISSALNR